MPTESLRLAIEIAEVADRAASRECLDVESEARRLYREHPDAPVSQSDIAEALREEADHASCA